MQKLESVRQRLIARENDSKADSIRMMMGKHGGVYGLAVAGASGLLALVYPEEFGTVDVMVTKALKIVGIHEVQNINPKAISVANAETMIEIMRVKAANLNRVLHSNKWTPRLVDRVLWTAGRKG